MRRSEQANDLAFKMAAMDVLWDSKMYRSSFCEFDLYYLGCDMLDIPKGRDIICKLSEKYNII